MTLIFSLNTQLLSELLSGLVWSRFIFRLTTLLGGVSWSINYLVLETWTTKLMWSNNTHDTAWIMEKYISSIAQLAGLGMLQEIDVFVSELPSSWKARQGRICFRLISFCSLVNKAHACLHLKLVLISSGVVWTEEFIWVLCAVLKDQMGTVASTAHEAWQTKI